MPQLKLKPCTLCQQPVSIRYRIQHTAEQSAQAQWVFVCPSCWNKVSPNNPNYRYGGTWKARKRSSSPSK